MNAPPLPNAPKKGLSGLAIAGIGCGGLLLLTAIGGSLLLSKGCSKLKEFAADVEKNPGSLVAMALKLNPNIEVLKTDDAKKEITFKDKQSGQVVTMSYEDAMQGKFKVTDDKGNVTTVDTSTAGQGKVTVKGPNGETVIGGGGGAAALPSWAPSYPGATAKEGGMHAQKGDQLSGVAVAETADPASKVKDFYESKLKAAGFKTDATVVNANGADSAVMNGTKDDSKQSVHAVITTEGGKTTIMLTYEGPK